jgi:predicted small lipoprotein YifL
VRRAAFAALAVAALAACGPSGSPAENALRDTAKNLGDIRSARLDLSMTAKSAASEPVGFSMKGPFALPDKEGLPVADVEVTELRGKQSTTSSFVSTGTEAYVVRDGRATKIAGGVKVGGESGGLEALRIDGWLRHPKIEDGPGDTERITAGLDVAAAFDDLGRLGERLGTSALAGLRPLDDAAKAQLEKSAKDSSIEVVTGKKDRLLRRLVLTVTLTAAGEVPSGLRSLVPVTLSLSMDLAEVNRPVRVEPPAT